MSLITYASATIVNGRVASASSPAFRAILERIIAKGGAASLSGFLKAKK